MPGSGLFARKTGSTESLGQTGSHKDQSGDIPDSRSHNKSVQKTTFNGRPEILNVRLDRQVTHFYLISDVSISTCIGSRLPGGKKIKLSTFKDHKATYRTPKKNKNRTPTDFKLGMADN